MKIAYLLILVGLSYRACKAQEEPWSKTKSWKIYSITGPAVFTCPVDSLKTARSISLDPDSVQYYLKNMQLLPEDKKPTWMGAFLGSYQSGDGKINKIEIGAYGGYFYDVTSDKYFALPRNLIRPWQKFIARNVPD